MLVTLSSVILSLLWMNLRSKSKIDYLALHRTGKRVIKMSDAGEQDPHGATSLKTWEDLEFNLDLFEDIEDYEFKSDVKEAITLVSDLLQLYRHVNVDLRVELGDEEFLKRYPRYDDNVKKATAFLKKAQKHYKTAKNDLLKIGEDQKELLQSEQEVLDMKIAQICGAIDLPNEDDVSEVESFVRHAEAFMSDYFDLCGKSKRLLKADHDDKTFTDQIEKLSDEIKSAKNVRKKLLEAQAKQEVELSQGSIKNDQILRGKNLAVEITQRLQGLEIKFEQDLDILGDYQLLEISQNKLLETDFNTVLEKVTDLAGLVSGGGEEVEKLLESAVTRKNEVIAKKDTFFKKLQSIVSARDATSDKLKNAASLKINLPKFSGYDCQMDFYTFKSEFKKLVEPVVQKQYLSDYLKRNYLTGSALSLVEKESEYSEIWKKLLDSFGNARLLLQNKLASLVGVGGLWKVKGEEKIRDSLAKVLNTMKDLEVLAAEHGIEGQLYEGGGLENIMALLGETRHRKFRSQNLDSSVSKKVEWGKLFKFLKDELNLREKMVLDIKSARLMGIELKSEKPKDVGGEKKKPFSGANVVPPITGMSKCHFCGESGHTVVITSKGKSIIPYYVCKKFIELSSSGRYEKLKTLNLCTTCLLPGAVKNSSHKCFYTNFCCQHTHSSSEKIHVLLCEQHKDDEKNKRLAEKFKDKFVKNCDQNLPQFCKNLSLLSFSVHISRDTEDLPFKNFKALPDVRDSGKFLLQTIQVQNIRLNIFFDNGCGDLVVRKKAVDLLLGLGRAKCEISEAMEVTGVGDQKAEALGL